MVRAPLITALIFLLIGGAFLLKKADVQARDTIRKHHLDDIEHALYFARNIHGTYPPYEASQWCGLLNDPASTTVRAQIETALRAQSEKYANLAKPFPIDPRADQPGYFYWKHSPTSFELYAILEADDNNNRNTAACPSAPGLLYDYGIASVHRNND